MKLSDVLARLSEKNENVFKASIKKIDRLLKNYDRESPVEVPVDHRMHRSVVQRLINHYSDPEMGWAVKEIIDGSLKSLEFSEPDFKYPEIAKRQYSRGHYSELT